MKDKRKIINNIYFFILGGIVFGAIGVFAATTLLSQSVYYNNSNSGATSTNVQGALDELYTKSNSWIDPSYIDFGSLSTNTTGTILASNNGMCIKRNNKVSCFIKNNYNFEKEHILQVFSDISCNVVEEDFYSMISCSAFDFSCYGDSGNRMICSDQSDGSSCEVDSSGLVGCS